MPATAKKEDNVVDMKSPKRAKFVEIGEKRMANALKAIHLIGNLGNRNAYEYDTSDVKKIVSALENAVETVASRLSHTETKASAFKL